MENIQEFLDNKYYSSLVILLSQILFIYLRTLNIIYTSERRMLATIITGNGIGIAWLISVAFSINSIIVNFQILPIVAYLVGGTLGTYFAIKKEIKNDLNKQ